MDESADITLLLSQTLGAWAYTYHTLCNIAISHTTAITAKIYITNGLLFEIFYYQLGEWFSVWATEM